MVLEFLHSFGPLFNIREVIREGVTFGEWGTREIDDWGGEGGWVLVCKQGKLRSLCGQVSGNAEGRGWFCGPISVFFEPLSMLIKILIFYEYSCKLYELKELCLMSPYVMFIELVGVRQLLNIALMYVGRGGKMFLLRSQHT